eukprot:COSAG01_NODE_9406_length_2454_cov_3.258599_1_plen_56_part_00
MAPVIIVAAAAAAVDQVALLNGTIAGLAGITPASGFVDNQGSLALGFLIGLSTCE